MQRKLIELSRRTFVLTIPISWMNDHSLKKGDKVDLFEKGSNLMITAPRSGRMSKSVIDVSNLNASLLWNAVVSRYVRGYGEITVHFKEGKIYDPRSGKKISSHEAIERVIDVLTGMTVINRTNSSITLQEILNPPLEEYHSILRRLWLIVMAMADECHSAMKKRDPKCFKKAIRAERDINHLSLYALRQLHIGVPSQVAMSLIESRLIYALELMGDSIKALEGSKQSSSATRQLNLVALLLRKAYACWFTPSDKAFDELYSSLMAVRESKPANSSALVTASEMIAESVTSRFVDLEILDANQ